jgi:hypothetical protein
MFTTETNMRGRPFAAVHGLGATPAYNSWHKMMARCYRPDNKDYPGYGGRGIKVCEQWHDVAGFVEDMGPREKGWSLERSDVNGDYSPENCRWIPMADQAKNRRPWKHSPAGLDGIAANWRGRTLSDQHKERIANSMRAYRAAQKT